MAAVLIKGKMSMDDARAEMVALSYDPKKAEELAQLLSDTRMMAVATGRMRFGNVGGPSEVALQSLERAEIRAEGPTVIASAVIPGDVIERALPRLVRALSKGINRIKRGPGYPS
jgi:hypothetical protein